MKLSPEFLASQACRLGHNLLERVLDVERTVNPLTYYEELRSVYRQTIDSLRPE